MFVSTYGINPASAGGNDGGSLYTFPLSASRFIPVARFSLGDGSAHFIKSTISSWTLPTGPLPAPVTPAINPGGNGGPYYWSPGPPRKPVARLSGTHHVSYGEAISSDAY